MLGHLTFFQRSLRLSSFLLIIFFFFPLCFIYFHHSIFHFTYPIFNLTYPIFCLSYSTVGFPRVLLISVIALFIIDWLFFFSSRSLLNISCIFSILASILFIYKSILLSKFWIILLLLFWILFQVDSLFPPLLFGLVGIYHVPLPAEYFPAFSFCLNCCVWGVLSVPWKFVVLLYCRACSLWVWLV